jgi:hypothetical protein
MCNFGGEGRVEKELRPHPSFESEVLIVPDTLRGGLIVGSVHELGDHCRRPFNTHVFEVDDQVVKVGVGDVGVEDLAAPPSTIFVGLANVSPGLVLFQTESLHRGLDPILHRSDNPNLECITQIGEQELAGKPVINAVAVREKLGDGRLGGEEVAGLAVGKALKEIGRQVKPPKELLFGHPIGLGRSG